MHRDGALLTVNIALNPFEDYVGGGTWVAPHHIAIMCSGSEAGSYLRLIDLVYHSTLGLRVIMKKKKALQYIAITLQYIRRGAPDGEHRAQPL